MMPRYRYPSIPHLPWSPGSQPDDLFLDETFFAGKEVVVTEKLDGENTTLSREYLHARSPDSRHHPSRDWVKALWGRRRYDLPEGWRFCGENVYAHHSIFYETLPTYFFVFSIWDETNRALSWDETVAWAELLEFHTVPVLWRGRWDEAAVQALKIDVERQEGYVVRTTEGFDYVDLARHVAKWVRPRHVQTDEHWMHRPVVPNRLARPEEESN